AATSAPAPSRFVFISELSSLPSDTKVRCLGCVVRYDLAEGRLLLEHAFPKLVQSRYQIWVDVNLVLESIDPQALYQGSWVNIIGYTRHTPSLGESKDGPEQQNSEQCLTLQAVLIWDAGPLQINDYTSTLEEQRLIQRRSKAGHS
ncbi:uncharacterized protein A1O9_00553, partial [Exophiala aquamarina CBS 119918]